MPPRKEIPVDPQEERFGVGRAASPPATDTEALMASPPFADPPTSREAMLGVRDVIQDAIDSALDERERWIFDACVVERKSIREVARELNLAKSWIDRIKQRACRKLRAALEDEPKIVEWLARIPTHHSEPIMEKDEEAA